MRGGGVYHKLHFFFGQDQSQLCHLLSPPSLIFDELNKLFKVLRDAKSCCDILRMRLKAHKCLNLEPSKTLLVVQNQLLQVLASVSPLGSLGSFGSLFFSGFGSSLIVLIVL